MIIFVLNNNTKKMPLKFKYQTGLTIPNSSNACSVRIRVSFQSKRVDLYTGIMLLSSQWNEKKQRVKQGCNVNGYEYNVLNDTLDKQEKFIRDYFNLSATRDVQPSLADLKDRFNKMYKATAEKQTEEFFYAFEQFRKQQEKARVWKQDMIDVFERLQEKVKAFKPDMKFTDLSIPTMNAFMEELSKTMYNDALIKHLSYFKQFITWCQKHHYPIHEDYFTFEPRLQTAKKAVRYLTIDELNTIYNLDLSDDYQLDRTRDLFVFQCYTALRYSDLAQLRHDNIYLKGEDYYIEILTEKDEDRIGFRLASRAVNIYNKYKHMILDDGKVFPVLQNQPYNRNLKELGKKAKLQGEWVDYEFRLSEKIEIRTPKDKLSTHTARRTFVVMAYNEGIPLEQIAMITSHSDVSKMKPYYTVLTKSTDKVIDAIDRVGVKKTKSKKAKTKAKEAE